MKCHCIMNTMIRSDQPEPELDSESQLSSRVNCIPGHKIEKCFLNHHELIITLLGIVKGPSRCNHTFKGHCDYVSWPYHRSCMIRLVITTNLQQGQQPPTVSQARSHMGCFRTLGKGTAPTGLSCTLAVLCIVPVTGALVKLRCRVVWNISNYILITPFQARALAGPL